MPLPTLLHARFALGGPPITSDTWLSDQVHQPDSPALVARLAALPTHGLTAPQLAALPIKQLRRDAIDGLLLPALFSPRRLEQTMLGFWGDHFYTNITKGPRRALPFKHLEQRALRPLVLGRFRDMLGAMCTSPAMLHYLDARLNRAEHPNENQARELLELHTLGIDGGYGHADILEAARVLSGWTVLALPGHARFGRVMFRNKLHHRGDKRVLGQRVPGGEQGLEVLLDQLASHRSTARHIAKKLCLRFASPTPTAPLLQAVTRAFTASGGQTMACLHAMTGHPDFPNSPPLLRRPLELVITLLRDTGAQLDADHALPRWLQRLGHSPWGWPTPDGYPVHPDAWDDDLRTRWSFAMALAGGRIRGVRAEPKQLVALQLPPQAQDLPKRLRPGLALAAPQRQWAGGVATSHSPRPGRFIHRACHPSPAHGPLVVVFLRGGADGLALVPPLNEPHLRAVRPTLWQQPLPLDRRFGLHPALRPLLRLYLQRRLSVVHAVGMRQDTTRSHFAVQSRLARSGGQDRSGWLGRLLQTLNSQEDSPLRAVAIGQRVPASLHGPVPVTLLPSLAQQQLPVAAGLRPRVEDALASLYGNHRPLREQARQALDAARALRQLPSPPSSKGPAFPRAMALAAQLLRSDCGVQLLHVDFDGWDTHASQANTLERLAQQLARGLADFDQATRHLPITTVVMSEFGRRVQENASGGTDHGAGGVMFLMGEGQHGVRARWPGLAPDQRVGPGDLAVTTDHQEVLAELLTKRLGLPQSVFKR